MLRLVSRSQMQQKFPTPSQDKEKIRKNAKSLSSSSLLTPPLVANSITRSVRKPNQLHHDTRLKYKPSNRKIQSREWQSEKQRGVESSLVMILPCVATIATRQHSSVDTVRSVVRSPGMMHAGRNTTLHQASTPSSAYHQILSLGLV